MKYTKFVIQNFKGIKHLILDLDKIPSTNIFTLVGLNESGKTTILEALHWFYKHDNYNPPELIPKNKLANFNGNIEVQAELKLTSEDENKISKKLKNYKFFISEPIDTIIITRKYKYLDSSVQRKNHNWDFKIVGKTKRMKDNKTYNENSEFWNICKKFIEEGLLPPIIYYQNFLFDFPDKIYLQIKNEQTLTGNDKFYRNVIQDVLNSLELNLLIKPHIVDRYLSKKDDDMASMESVLNKLASKIETEVFRLWRNLLNISGSGLSITFGQSLKEDNKGYYLQVKVKEGDQNYFIRERSLGFRWFFSFLLFTHFRSSRNSNYKNTLFLLDEPASNLHPTAQKKLLIAFNKFPNEQIIIFATHSHHMINPKWLSGTYVVKNEAKEYKEIDVSYNSYMTNIKAERYFKFVSQYPQDTDFFRPILDALDFQPSLLEATPELIITEGKNDFYTLKFLYDFKYIKTKIGNYIFPSTGKDKTEYIVSLYISWGQNFIVLLDDDSGGRKTYKRLKKEYGNIIENKIFRLNHIDKRWKGFTLEDVFVVRDQIKIQKSVYVEDEEYNKQKFNTSLQNLYLKEQKLELNINTLKRFQKLNDFLENKLKENLKT